MNQDDTPALEAPPPSPAQVKALTAQLKSLAPRRRVDLLLDQPNLSAVLERLPVQDVYGLIRQVGVADCLELLDAAPPQVVQGFMDFSVWGGGGVDPRNLASFYAALFHNDPDAAVEKVMHMDPEMRLLFLKLHTQVLDITVDGVPDHDAHEHFTTPDGKILVLFVDPPGLPEESQDTFGLGERGRALARHAAKVLVETLTRRDPAFISQLMDEIRYELPSQLEEEALRWRDARLADLGLPPREEALVVLSYLDPDKPTLNPPAPLLVEETPDAALCLYAWPDDSPPEPFLAAALLALTPMEQETFARELAVTCNWVAVARNVDPGDPDALRGAVRETRITLNLGLAYRTAGKTFLAAGVLRTSAVMDLFRAGNSLGLKLARQALKVVKAARTNARVTAAMLDAPHGMALAALLGRQPLFFNGLTTPQEVTTRPFATLEDLALTARSLAESAFRLTLGLEVLGVRPEMLRQALLLGTNHEHHTHVTLEVLFTTALARAALGGALSSAPLHAGELEQARAAVQQSVSVERAAAALARVACDYGVLPGAPTRVEVEQRCAGLAKALLLEAAQEVSHVPAGDRLDPRFLSRWLVALPV